MTNTDKEAIEILKQWRIITEWNALAFAYKSEDRSISPDTPEQILQKIRALDSYRDRSK